VTNIPYLDEVWNLTRGCTKVSAGCAHCYAERITQRFWRGPKGMSFNGAIDVSTVEKALDKPLHWRKPRRVGLCFMSDLFHEKVPDEFLDKVFAVMALTPQHTYLLLTKRPERMREYISWRDDKWPRFDGRTETRTRHDEIVEAVANMGLDFEEDAPIGFLDDWPLPNVWLGVSVENQQAADERIPLLLDTPAAHRWLSVEPLLGAVDLRRVSPGLLGTSAIFDALGGRRWEDNGETLNATACARLDWVVVGGESGPKARTMDVEWMSDLQQQCLSADVPFYCKQDSGPRPGMQGRILDALWAVKQLPGGWA